MSVMIKGMDMPKNCSDCEFHRSDYPDWCDLSITCRDMNNTSIRQEWCPLVEVPDHAIICGTKDDGAPVMMFIQPEGKAEWEIDKFWERSETVNVERSENGET